MIETLKSSRPFGVVISAGSSHTSKCVEVSVFNGTFCGGGSRDAGATGVGYA